MRVLCYDVTDSCKGRNRAVAWLELGQSKRRPADVSGEGIFVVRHGTELLVWRNCSLKYQLVFYQSSNLAIYSFPPIIPVRAPWILVLNTINEFFKSADNKN